MPPAKVLSEPRGCRKLVALGADAEPAEVRGSDGRLVMTIPHVGKASLKTVAESARTPIKLVKYEAFQEIEA
jgi:hypothetical protein